MVEIAGGAKWDFGFDMISAAAVGVMDGTRAKSEVDIIGGETELFSGIDGRLVETKLLLWLSLDFV